MPITLSIEQVETAVAATIACMGWLILQWRKADERYKHLLKSFHAELQNDATKMKDAVDAEITSLRARIGTIQQNMATLADELGRFRASTIQFPDRELDRVARELHLVEAELNAVTARAKEVRRRRLDAELVLKALHADSFNMTTYEESRAAFAARTSTSVTINLGIPSLGVNPWFKSPEEDQKYLEMEMHARRLQSNATQLLQHEILLVVAS